MFLGIAKQYEDYDNIYNFRDKNSFCINCQNGKLYANGQILEYAGTQIYTGCIIAVFLDMDKGEL